MGYAIEFNGRFKLNKPLKPEHKAYLTKFNDTRRMKRLVAELREIPDPLREAVGLPLGSDGCYFVGSTALAGQDFNHPSVLDSNVPPSGQPSLWCHWTPSNDGQWIEWDEGEKFSEHINWLQYLIDHFLGPWGYVLNGSVHWEGGYNFDNGIIRVRNNRITIFGPIVVTDEYGEPRHLRVFLCHSSTDKPLVRDLYHTLSQGGIDPWFDEVNLLPGQDWELEIRQAVRQSDIVIVCLSRTSINKIGFIQKEIKLALDVADEQPEGSIFIIPAKLEECNTPERLSQWQWVNLFQEDGYERLESALRMRAKMLSSLVEKGESDE